MKNKLKIILIIIAVLSCIFIFYTCKNILDENNKPYQKYSTETDPAKYLKFSLLDDGTYQVDGFVDLPVLDLVIPSTYNDVPITTIKESAFEQDTGLFSFRKPLNSVIIEEGITTVKSKAFNYCGAKNFTLPLSITHIYDYAFNTDNYKINFPTNLKYIGSNAFCGATFNNDFIEINDIELKPYSLSETNVKKIVFLSDYIVLPHSIFYGCSTLEEIILPNCLEIIPDYAFSRCVSLQEITIGENVKTIGDCAFGETKLQKVTFSGKSITIDDSAFFDCNDIKSLELNDVHVESQNIGRVFASCPLDNITISNNSKYNLINGAICEKTNQVTTLLLGINNFNNFDDIDYINQYAFASCTFNELSIPSSIIEIRNSSFYFAKIKKLNCLAKNLNYRAFFYAHIQEARIYSEFIDEESFSFVSELKTLHLENGVKRIKSKAFVNMSDTETIYISETVEVIEKAAFMLIQIKDVYYLKKNTPIVDLHAGTFIYNISNVLTEDNRIKATIKKDLKIHVYSQIFDECIRLWSDMENDDKYIYHESLKNHIVADLD
jgi:hypothetical protein